MQTLWQKGKRSSKWTSWISLEIREAIIKESHLRKKHKDIKEPSCTKQEYYSKLKILFFRRLIQMHGQDWNFTKSGRFSIFQRQKSEPLPYSSLLLNAIIGHECKTMLVYARIWENDHCVRPTLQNRNTPFANHFGWICALIRYNQIRVQSERVSKVHAKLR